jgi:CRP/FNR family cyclic AMP-dependent transcriptional regulator
LDFSSFLEPRLATFFASLADPWQQVALAAAAVAGALIVASTLVKTIIPLRWLALGGNVGFVVYGLVHPAPMVFVLHVVLLPINLWRVLEMQRLTRRLRDTDHLGTEELKVWLQPFMKRRRLQPGTVLFRQGDLADRLYVLAEGRLEVMEAGRTIEAGQMFGEIAFFSPGQKRTASVRCVEPSTLLSIDEVSFRRLFFQNPAFGFEVARLIAGRLSDDVSRLQRADPEQVEPPLDYTAAASLPPPARRPPP